jgi:hypothetical protein
MAISAVLAESSTIMIRKNVAEILHDHVTFELEAIDRMYLNAYVPSLQTGGGLAYFLKTQLGVRVPSTVMVAPMSQRFVEAIERFGETQGVDLITFEKGQRKDDVAQKYLAAFEGDEGVLFVGKAQEKASVFRTEKRVKTPRGFVIMPPTASGDDSSLEVGFSPAMHMATASWPYHALPVEVADAD